VKNVFFCFGVGSILYGLWTAWPPLAYIITGAGVVILTLLAPDKPKKDDAK